MTTTTLNGRNVCVIWGLSQACEYSCFILSHENFQYLVILIETQGYHAIFLAV